MNNNILILASAVKFGAQFGTKKLTGNENTWESGRGLQQPLDKAILSLDLTAYTTLWAFLIIFYTLLQ